MHSHHSHSGSFCQHAKDTLEQIIERAIQLGFRRYCLTEHIPRLESSHLYPEEVDSNTSVSDLSETFDNYIQEARRLKLKYAGQIDILVGFETEGINEEYLAYVQDLQRKYSPELIVGSLHHCGPQAFPIDFDAEKWQSARTEAGGSTVKLYSAYFDQQYELIDRLSPSVIGHFDLIRLFTPQSDSIPDLSSNPTVWAKVERNIKLGIERGCLFELNSAALSKGWSTPYPQRDVAKCIKDNGGHFCLSDDAHSVAHVGRNYRQAIDYLGELGIGEVFTIGTNEATNLADLRKWASDYL